MEVILKETIAKLETENDIIVEDIRIEELNATYKFKHARSDEYMIMSVEHYDLTEMFEVDFDLQVKVREDNEEVSLFT